MGLEQLDELGEIGKRAGQPIDLVNQHNVDLARPDVRELGLQSGPLQGAAGETAIVIAAKISLQPSWAWLLI